jgi:hypothetical protein
MPPRRAQTNETEPPRPGQQEQEHKMAARGKNAKKKSKRRRHANTRKLEREATAANTPYGATTRRTATGGR